MLARTCLLTFGFTLLLSSGCATISSRGNKTAADLPPSKSAEACLVTAKELEKRGHDVEAIDMYRRARRFDPKIKGVSRRLAVLHDKQSNIEAAHREFGLALKESPRDAELWNDYGYFHYQHKRYAEAEKAFRKAVDRDKDLTRAQINLGLALGEQRKYDESYEAFRHVVSESSARHNIGIMLLRHGETDSAKRAFDIALALEPKLAQSRAVVAWLDEQENETPSEIAAEAQEAIQLASASEPAKSESPTAIQSVMQHAGNQKKAGANLDHSHVFATPPRKSRDSERGENSSEEIQPVIDDSNRAMPCHEDEWAQASRDACGEQCPSAPATISLSTLSQDAGASYEAGQNFASNLQLATPVR